jgi:hypothetical protein
MRTIRKTLFGLGLLVTTFGLLQPPAMAGNAMGLVSDLTVRDSDGLIYVRMSTAPSGRPTCAAGTTYFMVRNENSETGKKLYALLLAAKLTGQTVTIVGANTCNRWGDGEDIDYATTH